jgi:hypothetical protein
MFLDSLVNDAGWRAMYARDESGTVIPFEILEEEIRATHPFAVFQLRAMLAVSYFEKALYELPEDQVTKEIVLKLADQVENDIQGGLSRKFLTHALFKCISISRGNVAPHTTQPGLC